MLSRMAENEKKDAHLLDRLEEMLKRYGDGDAPLQEAFSEDEVAALKRVAARERAYEAIGEIGKSLKTILTYIGFFIGVYIAIKTGAIEWIRSVVSR